MKIPIFKLFALMALLWLLAAMAYAQAPSSPPYISAPVMLLEVNVPPLRPTLKPVVPEAFEPMVTYQKVSACRLNHPHQGNQSPIPRSRAKRRESLRQRLSQSV